MVLVYEDTSTFVKERNDLQSKITEMKEKLRHTEDRAEKWLELTERTCNFATYARPAFLNGGLELKKEIPDVGRLVIILKLRQENSIWRQ